MREILFRGKRFDDQTWIYGSLLEDDVIAVKGAIDVDEDYIGVSGDWSSVDPATVGQFTGLTDKNGVKIFEGDIVEIIMPRHNDKPIKGESPVFWCESSWRVHWGSERDKTRLDDFSHDVTFEVIGQKENRPG